MTEKLTAQSANRPREYCGHLTPPLVAGERTECVLRPGHSGSHADDRGGRWRYDPHYHLAPAGLREQIAAALEDYPADHWTPSDVAGWIMPTVAAAFDQYREQVANNAEQPPRTTPNNPAAALEIDVDVLHRKLLAAKRAARHIGAWGVLQAIDEAGGGRTTPDNPTASSNTADNPLRQRIAAALYEHSNPGYRWADAHPHDLAVYGADADAVLAVRDRDMRVLADEVTRLSAITGQLRDLAGRWQATVRPGETHPAAAAILGIIDGDGPSVRECAKADRVWPLEKAGE